MNSDGRTQAISAKQRLLEVLGEDRHGGLRVGGILAEQLAERFGTPLYVFDAQVIRATFARVRAAFGPSVEVLFALKANPNAAVAQTLRLAGAGCDVASAGEILIARKAGYNGSQIQFAGPGKHGRDLALSLDHQVSVLNIESPAEYEAIRDAARARQVSPGIAIRVNPPEGPRGSRLHMGGGSKKFGVDRELVRDLVNQILADGVCRFRGLHVYSGTQNFEAGGWLDHARGLRDLARELETSAPVQTLNFGGGFGVALFDGDGEFDLDRAGAGLRALIAEDAGLNRRYFVELGRYLVATAGVYLTRVLYAKESAGKRHLIVDGGMHQHGAAAGMGAIIRRAYPIVLCRDPDGPGGPAVTIGGPLCTPADEFASNLPLPAARASDVLAVLGSGAYGLTFSNVLFLSHPLPGEVLVDRGRACLVRTPGRDEDVLNGQVLPTAMERPA